MAGWEPGSSYEGGMRREWTYCFGFVLVTDLGISFA
jgi:hypothetical protein